LLVDGLARRNVVNAEASHHLPDEWGDHWIRRKRLSFEFLAQMKEMFDVID
jgi:hypothetical protein